MSWSHDCECHGPWCTLSTVKYHREVRCGHHDNSCPQSPWLFHGWVSVGNFASNPWHRNQLSSCWRVFFPLWLGLWDQTRLYSPCKSLAVLLTCSVSGGEAAALKGTGDIWPWCFVWPVHDLRLPLHPSFLSSMQDPSGSAVLSGRWERNQIIHVCGLWKTLVAHLEKVGFYHMGQRLGKAGYTGCTLEEGEVRRHRDSWFALRDGTWNRVIHEHASAALFNFLEKSSPFFSALFRCNWL